MISVIVLTYNQQQTIARALDSILAQQCEEPVEIMLSDDASTDQTPAICRDYAARFPDRINLNVNKQNKGIVRHYFDTLLQCRGDLIADLAGDDEWCDTMKLEKERRILRQHPDVTLVHTAWRTRTEATGELSTARNSSFPAPFTDGREMLEAIITQTSAPVIHLCTALYRKSVFLKEYADYQDLFTNNEYGCEDVQLTFFMARNGRIAYLPDVTLNYSIGDGSISNNHADHAKQFLFFLRAANLSHRIAILFNLNSPQTASFFSHRTYELLMHALRANRPDLRSTALQARRRWQAPHTLKTLIPLVITSNPLTWRLALLLRHLLRKT